MGVSKNYGTPKWMVYNGKPYEQMDDLGGFPIIFGNTQISFVGVANLRISIFEYYRFQNDIIDHMIYCRVPKGGGVQGGGNWGTLRIPREDWGTLGKIREP